MKAIKHLSLAALAAATTALSAPVLAQAMDHGKMHQSGAAAELTDGEIRKIDKDGKKLTIKHGEIKHLDMPGMTMVFPVKDATMLDRLKVGDKIRFKVEQAGSGLLLTELLPAGK